MADTTTTEKTTVATEEVEAEELIALIKAIKFAYEDFGCKRVHDQIKTHGGKYERVPLKRVKKYMQKLGLTQPDDPLPGAAAAASAASASGKDADLKAHAKASAKGGAIQLMTVGGASKSERPAAATPEPESTTKDKWLPVKLDEPASKSGQFPYEAVIRMTHNDEGDATGALGEIYKIQASMLPGGTLSLTNPMMVYNKARNRKTFLHPDSPAYMPVLTLIKAQGIHGVLGGAKAYYWGRYRHSDDMLYININQLAPVQQW